MQESHSTIPLEYLRELSYNADELRTFVNQNEPLLNPEQRHVYNTILDNIDSREGKVFFLDAPGGTGKTFLLNLLLAKVWERKKIALAVASSGIRIM